ncbi:MAG: reverse transcriptase family protein, partial [Planctomycetota bacterium]
DRLRRKEQKKVESEKRKTLHRERVHHRRTTDIVFLGRGVSKGLADCRSSIEKLHSFELPVMATPADLARAMGLSIPQLRWLSFHSDAPTRTHYINFTIPKRSGGTRKLSCPHAKLAAAQQWILTSILSRVPVHEAAHGFVANHSVATNALQHVNSAVVINTDLKDFFPSITFIRVRGLFQRLGYSPAVATILALLCTECPRTPMQLDGTTYHAAAAPRSLPQGACTSPALSNLIATKLDRRMSAMATKLGWRYSRYADDLTWSTSAEPSPSIGYVLARIRHITQDEGFELNHDKTRIQRRSQRQTVTGVVVNDQLNVPRETVRRVRAILHNAQKTGLVAQNKDQHPHFESWLLGMIGWISMVNPTQGEKLMLQFRELRK